MRQFKQLGWIPQALLSLVLLSAMSQSHAMSVRERYLQEHPAAKVESSPEKISTHHKKHHVSEKHVVKTSEHHAEKVASKKHTHHSAVKAHAKVEHAKVEHAKVEHVKHHAGQHSIKKEVVESKAKSPSNRVNIPKLAPTKFDSQQARAAEEALQHQSVKKEVQAESVPTKRHHEVAPVVKQSRHEAKHHKAVKHAAAKPTHHHAAKPVREHHHKRHHAE